MRLVQGWLVARAALAVVLPAIIWAGIVAANVTIPVMDPWHLVVDLAMFIAVVTAGYLMVPAAWRRDSPVFTMAYFPAMCLLLYLVGAEVAVRFLADGP